MNKKSELLNGKALAADIQKDLAKRITAYSAKGLRPPELAVILIGEDAASHLYVRNKHQACMQAGIKSHNYTFKDAISEAELLKLIHSLNANPNVDGILIQLPLPSHINPNHIIEAIDPRKDVDGFHPYNLGRLAQKRPFLRPCTPYGVMLLLEKTSLKLTGLEATVIGVSNIVGRPMILELLMSGCTVTACHRHTQDVRKHIEKADIVVSATGSPHLIKGEWIKPGACVIDVGIHRLPNGQFVGDVEFENAQKHAGWITPVPGGVGPMTVTVLLLNTLMAYEHHLKNTASFTL